MTRQRKEIQKRMWELEREEMAENELGCGMFSEQISRAFAPYHQKLQDEWCATYGRTEKEQMDYVFAKLDEAYEAGRIPWSPCWGIV